MEGLPAYDVDELKGTAPTTAVLHEVNQAHGTTYRLTGPLLGGFQSGAWLITDASGSPAVLKWSPEHAWAAQIQRAARAVATARRHGYPTPAWLAVGSTRAGHGYQVQEFAAGRPNPELTPEVAGAMIELVERQMNLDPDPDRSWSTYLADELASSWASTTATVRGSGPAGTALVDACSALLAPFDTPAFPSSDLVHGDLRLGNVLFHLDRVSAVIDIEALGSGTRVFDYATLLDHEQADEQAVRLLVDAASQAAGPGVLAFSLAHVVLDLAQFVHRRQLTADDPSVCQRIRSLTTRTQLVRQMLS